ncbi:MAG TPA: lipocalin-like domain-containing protein [Ignavibacteriaceae bacterium]|nr:lipocalin-like domain-containing protein [Ignavibacteriaceae bacterium]
MKNFLFIFSLVVLLFACDDKKVIDSEKGVSLSKAMGEVADEDFSKAVDKRKFVFPDDHGPHPAFRTEWWYFTGNLSAGDGKEFGYQFTIFRTALSKEKSERNSEWNSNQIYMAHFAVTDIDGNKFYFDERFSREGNNLAGAQASPFKVWVEDWQIIQIQNEVLFDLPIINVRAKTENFEIDFILESVKPFVLQGDEGLSQKGKQPGNASYYYSYTRLKTEGKIILEGKEFFVNGFSWMDREWSTSALSEDQKGWDWFALQLDDNTEIMYYQMRKKDGTSDVFSKGVFVDETGSSQLIKKDDVVLEVNDYWESPTGEKYPSGWNLQIPSKEIDLKITPAVRNQLMDVAIRYWEGSVKIEGTKSGSKTAGRGYVELTGY